MERVRRLFKDASVGFGECGASEYASIAEHKEVIQDY